MIRTYTELMTLPTFRERFLYLKLNGQVGDMTFGGNRHLNQAFYCSAEWKAFRRKIILRDGACDLADPDREIHEHIYIHHLNPISVRDVLDRNPCVLDPENAITTIFNTHQAIHYGDESLLLFAPVERAPYDTCPWR